jgi:hypothetical protein
MATSDRVSRLAKQTGDRPVGGVNPDAPEDHSAHIGMAMAQGRGFPKVPNLPASGFNAKGTLASSKLRKEFVDIPMDHVKLHTFAVRSRPSFASCGFAGHAQRGGGLRDRQT